MRTKKEYIAPNIEIVMVVQESLLQNYSKVGSDDYTGGSSGQPGIADYARYQRFSLWDEEETRGSLWDE